MAKKNPTLVGIILDVSSSMRKNWKNAAGKRAPRFEIIRDALNDQLWKLAALRDEDAGEIEFFCLGMGLRRTVTRVPVDLQNKEEKLKGEAPQTFYESDLVCDLLVLSQVIPTKSTLEEIKESLDQKWRIYANNLLRDINGRISADARQDLHDFIQHGIEESATDSLHHSWRYVLLTGLERTSLRARWSWLNRLSVSLFEHTNNWEAKIQQACSSESDKFVEAIQFRVGQFFESKQSAYSSLINTSLHEFASIQIQVILELLTARHTVQLALDQFDENTASEIAKEIYQHLDEDVTRHLQIPILKELEQFVRKLRFELHASVDRRFLRSLTRDYIQLYAWAALEPFIEKTVFDIITERFEEVARKMLLYWVSIAAKRELIQSVRDFKGILPEAISEETLQNEYLFGTTPIKEVLSAASARLLDSKYESHNKFLIVVSDGEFDSDSSAQSLKTSASTLAELLKRSGVTIISLCVTRGTPITQLISQISPRRPLGVRTMFAISSKIQDDPKLADWFLQENPALSLDERLFIQVNEASLLQEAFDAIRAYTEP